jgi:hypothetical protein
VHHPKKQQRVTADAAFKAEQEKRRKEEAIANATGLRVLSAISAAVPVRLMKRDLLFVAERMVNLLTVSGRPRTTTPSANSTRPFFGAPTKAPWAAP